MIAAGSSASSPSSPCWRWPTTSSVLHDAVSQHMTTDLLTVEASDPIRKVADLCVVHRVRRVPVMENGRLVGLISRCDVLRAIYEATAAAAAPVARDGFD